MIALLRTTDGENYIVKGKTADYLYQYVTNYKPEYDSGFLRGALQKGREHFVNMRNVTAITFEGEQNETRS